MSELTASLYKKMRPIEVNHFSGWQDDSDVNVAANEIISQPDKYLLSAKDLYKAEGGPTGLALQASFLLLGVGSVFAT